MAEQASQETKYTMYGELRVSDFNHQIIEALKNKFGATLVVEVKKSYITLSQMGIKFATMESPTKEGAKILFNKFKTDDTKVKPSIAGALEKKSAGYYYEGDNKADLIVSLENHYNDLQVRQAGVAAKPAAKSASKPAAKPTGKTPPAKTPPAKSDKETAKAPPAKKAPPKKAPPKKG